MELETLETLSEKSPADCLSHYKEYVKFERERVRKLHEAGGTGIAVCEELSASFDRLLSTFYQLAVREFPEMGNVALVANGGYGRGKLSPGSDIDLLFLTPMPTVTLSEELKQGIDKVLYPLWDLNLKLGHAVRSISENISEGKKDRITRTALLDSRLIDGDETLFDDFKARYRKEAIENDKVNFFAERSHDMSARHKKYFKTIFLQEPNVKESPGGLRDWHNLQWLMESANESRDLSLIQDDGVINENAAVQIQESVDFLMRLRNEMHFRTGKAVDILSLRLQGEVAEAFDYEGEDILIKIEKLMRDYYTHARNLHNRVKGVFDILEIESDAFKGQSLTSWLPWMKNKLGKQRKFDGFCSQEDFLYAVNEDIFEKDSGRMLRAFLHCQKHGLTLSPSLRSQINTNLPLIDKSFLFAKENRDAIDNIMGMRGRVSRTFRSMHRIGILGKIFPEFGALDCLVQHEFFHRYTADEHTLRCLDMLDRITSGNRSEDAFYGRLFKKMQEPMAMYIALLLHDTGRALNTDDHVDGSSVMANDVCRRLDITGETKELILFLVDHHLTLFKTGTKNDTDDPEVIKEFCSQMKTADRLEMLLVFTYCDSNATNPDGWNGWKELAIKTLYKRAHQALKSSKTEEKAYQNALLKKQKTRLEEQLDDKYHEVLEKHYKQMPLAYFRYREWESVAKHVRAMWQYENRRARRPDTPFEAAIQWAEHEALGYSEVCVVTPDKANLLASICCAFASYEINILSANVHTRSDGLVLDLFRVCDMEQEAVIDDLIQMQVVTAVYDLNKEKSYNPEEHIKEKKGFFDEEPAIKAPPIVDITNDEHEHYTMIEVQATDRIGLLHDLLSLFTKKKFTTKGARITTERNTAIDSFLVVDQAGEKLDLSQCDVLIREIEEVAG